MCVFVCLNVLASSCDEYGGLSRLPYLMIYWFDSARLIASALLVGDAGSLNVKGRFSFPA